MSGCTTECYQYYLVSLCTERIEFTLISTSPKCSKFDLVFSEGVLEPELNLVAGRSTSSRADSHIMKRWNDRLAVQTFIATAEIESYQRD